MRTICQPKPHHFGLSGLKLVHFDLYIKTTFNMVPCLHCANCACLYTNILYTRTLNRYQHNPIAVLIQLKMWLSFQWKEYCKTIFFQMFTRIIIYLSSKYAWMGKYVLLHLKLCEQIATCISHVCKYTWGTVQQSDGWWVQISHH